LQETWATALRTRFFNIRRWPKLEAMGLEIKPSPPKCQKSNSYHPVLMCSSSTEQDKTVYQCNKMAMHRIKYTDQATKTAQFLMKETPLLRHKWIEEYFPIVSEILSEFPLLKCYSNVSS